MNDFLVGVQGGETIVILRPVPQQITKAQALNLAAWLVVLADDRAGDSGGKFDAAMQAVLGG